MKPRKLTSRQAFERWADEEGWAVERNGSGYHSMAHFMYQAWQAAIRFERSRMRGKK